jgi:hypothetical protein
MKEHAEALDTFSSPFLASLYREIISFAAENRLPAIYLRAPGDRDRPFRLIATSRYD